MRPSLVSRFLACASVVVIPLHAVEVRAQADVLISDLSAVSDRASHADMAPYYIEACIRFNASVDFDFEAELAPGPQDTRLRCNTVWSATQAPEADLSNPTDPFRVVASRGISAATADETATYRGQGVSAQVYGQPQGTTGGLGALAAVAGQYGAGAFHWSSQAAGDAMAPWTVTMSGFYAYVKQTGNAFEPGFDSDDFSVTLTADYFVSERIALGGGVTYHDVDAVIKDNGGSLDTEDVDIFAYASLSLTERWYLDGLVSYTWSDHTQVRTLRYQEIATAVQPNAALIDQRMTGRNDSEAMAFSAGTGYNLSSGNWQFTPYARVDYGDVEIDGFTESPSNPGAAGFGLALVLDAQKYETLTSSIGLHVGGAWAAAGIAMHPYVFAEYAHEFENDARDLTGRFVTELDTTQGFSVSIAAPDRNYFAAGAGVMAEFADTMLGFVRYQGLIDYRGLDVHAIEFGLRHSF